MSARSRPSATALRWAGSAALLLLAALPWVSSCQPGPLSLRRERSELRSELSNTEAQIRENTELRAEERRRWRERAEHLGRWLPRAVDEPRILAELARYFEGPSVRDLQLLRETDASVASGLEWETLELTDPTQSRQIQIRAVPIRIRLRADYAGLAAILETLESRTAPLLPERIAIEREAGGLRLETELLFVVRGAWTNER